MLDHWASFGESFGELCELLELVATGRDDPPPKTIVMLSGDVHHCYLAEVGFAAGTGARSSVWQAVCSAFRKDLAPREKLAMRAGNSRPLGLLAHALARAAGAPEPPVGWRMVHEPSYDNQVGCLRLGRERASVTIETTEGSSWRDPDLRIVFEQELL